MPIISHDNRAVRVTTALPSNELLFKSMVGQDGLSTLFDYQVSLVTESASIDLNKLLGTEMLVSVDLVRGGERYFHGHVSHCALTGSDNGYLQYQCSLKPWFWFLTRTSDCRIFQQISIPDIIDQVFRDEGFTDFEMRLTASYDALEYCVQYQETDFNFVSRLMEEVGIYYYFIHAEDSHMMILCDSFSAHDPFDSYDTVSYHEAGNDLAIDEDHIDQWGFEKQLQPGKYASQDYFFKDPKADLLVNYQFENGHARSNFELYEYPGTYRDRAAGEALVKNRLEETHTQFIVFSGSGDVNGLCSGFLFNLTDYLLSDQNREYLVRDASYDISMDDYTSGGDGVFDFKTKFHAIISDQQFRAARTTQKPKVQGPQTAKVVGPSGEEIWTDEFGRVKLQFHWDRYGVSDENSSCWVRVSQVWAGAGWGAMHIPRIGQEVIVECLEGDPDRPIVTGRVYNGDNPVPYKLPDNKTQSGIKSRSSLNGKPSNFNEIRMEDKKGSEELYFHAEKNQTTVVKNNQSISVGVDRSVTVGNDETITVEHDRIETVKNDETITIDKNRKSDIYGNSESWVYKNEDNYVQEKKYTFVKGTFLGEFESTHDTKVKNDITVTTTDGKILLDASTSIKLMVGSSSLEMKADGKITIKGSDIMIEGTTSVKQKAPAIESAATGKNEILGASITSSASGINEIKGGIVKLNV